MIDFDMTLIDNDMNLTLYQVSSVEDSGNKTLEIAFPQETDKIMYWDNFYGAGDPILKTENNTHPNLDIQKMKIINYDEVKNFDPNTGESLTIKLSSSK